MIILYLFLIWFLYTFAESLSFELKLSGQLAGFYPLGISYSNILLTMCRFLNLIVMVPLALYFDNSARQDLPVHGFYIALAFPASAICAQVVFKLILPKIRDYFILFITKKGRIVLTNEFNQKKLIKKKIKFNRSLCLLTLLMFGAAYSAIPLSILVAAKYLEFRATIFQMVTIFSGVYALINTIIIDPIFSKRYLSPIYYGIYNHLMKLRNFSIFIIQPLIIIIGAIYV